MNNDILWNVKIHQQHIKRSHGMMANAETLFFIVEVGTDLTCCSVLGRVVTKFMNWGPVIKQPLVLS